MRALSRAWLALAALLALPAGAPAPGDGLRVERVVLLMRHGVRPPTKPPSERSATDPWPSWPVAWGDLTPHGAQAIGLVGRYDRAKWQAAGVLPRTGCTRIRVMADSDQRTIATANAYADAIAPGCVVVVEHLPQGEPDPIFDPVDETGTHLSADSARAAVIAAAGAGGLAGMDARLRSLVARLDTILCGARTDECGIDRKPTALAPVVPGRLPRLTGTLDHAATAAQTLLLEYVEGMPAKSVGWGRATAADIAQLSALHAAAFALTARPRPIARAATAGIAPLVADALAGEKAAAVTVIVGHDGNVASLGGLLGLHWRVPGLAADDPAPGGALVFERLVDASGHRFVRALYRSPTPAQIRALTPANAARPYDAVLPIAGCAARGVKGLCTATAFAAALAG